MAYVVTGIGFIYYSLYIFFTSDFCFGFHLLCFSCKLQSRSTWYPLALSQSRASRGEKLNTNHQQHQQDTNIYGLLHHENENQSQICGSNPLIGQLSQSTANQARKKPLKYIVLTMFNFFCFVIFQFSWDPTKKVKLEMEEFGDLTAYLPANVMSSYKNEANSVDELNTPVFGEYPFIIFCFICSRSDENKKHIFVIIVFLYMFFFFRSVVCLKRNSSGARVRFYFGRFISPSILQFFVARVAKCYLLFKN